VFYPATSLVTIVALAIYFWMATRVARTRVKVGIRAPVMTGNDLLERTIRAHTNTLEWLPIFLPCLWLFAVYWGDRPAAALGAVWALGRIVYFLGYVRSVAGRAPGFLIQTLAASMLLLGAAGRIIWLLVTNAP
jgi:uncharacterized membrane protein YecN with MAPEG domain